MCKHTRRKRPRARQRAIYFALVATAGANPIGEHGTLLRSHTRGSMLGLEQGLVLHRPATAGGAACFQPHQYSRNVRGGNCHRQ